jgi:hypothetical protein
MTFYGIKRVVFVFDRGNTRIMMKSRSDNRQGTGFHVNLSSIIASNQQIADCCLLEEDLAHLLGLYSLFLNGNLIFCLIITLF